MRDNLRENVLRKGLGVCVNVFYSFPLRIGMPGTGMTAWHQVSGISRRGARVFLCCGSIALHFDGLAGKRETLKLLGMKIPIRVLGLQRAMALHDRIAAKLLQQFDGKYGIDVVHCWPSGSLETLKAANGLGVTSFLERPNAHTRFACEVVASEYEKLGLPLPHRNSHSYRVGRVEREEEEYARADKLLCPSSFVEKSFLEKGMSKEKLNLHHYGYNPTTYFVDTSRNGNLPFSVAFVGLCCPRKGLHYALKAWLSSDASNTGHFYICGRFASDRYRASLGDMIEHPSVHEMGFVTDIATVLRRCHILMLPAIEEGSALVTYEARACGCVLLVSDAAGAHLKHGVEGLIHRVGDVGALRDQIELLYFDRQHYQKLREKSLATIANFTWDKAAAKLINIYNSYQPTSL